MPDDPVLPRCLEAEASGSTSSDPTQVLDSACLLQGAREVMILHGTERYRLRHTRNDKLILTK